MTQVSWFFNECQYLLTLIFEQGQISNYLVTSSIILVITSFDAGNYQYDAEIYQWCAGSPQFAHTGGWWVGGLRVIIWLSQCNWIWLELTLALSLAIRWKYGFIETPRGGWRVAGGGLAGGWLGFATIQLPQPSSAGTWAELGKNEIVDKLLIVSIFKCYKLVRYNFLFLLQAKPCSL